MEAFWVSLGVIFVAELGDKTQLVALSLAARFRVGVVLVGILAATLAVHVFSVVLGGWFGAALPHNWISLLAGLAFIGFGFWTLKGDCLDEESCKINRCVSPFWIVAITFFLAELGDKTMLSTVALAAKPGFAALPVWIGSSLGMVVSDGLAIIVGRVLGTNLPQRTVKIGAASIFFLFGAYSIYTGGHALPFFAWGVAAAVIALFLFIYLRGLRRQAPAHMVELELSLEEEKEEVVGANRN